MAREPNAQDLMRAFEEEHLVELYSPALAGPKLNLPVLAKLQKARQLVPFGWDQRMNSLPLFLTVLLEKLNAKERTALIAAAALGKSEVAAWQKLEARGEEAGEGVEESEAAKGFAALSGAAKGSGRAGAVFAGLLDAADCAGSHSELLPEVSAGVARNHG